MDVLELVVVVRVVAFSPSRASGLAAAVNLSEEHRSARETTRDVSVPCVSILTPVSPEILGAVAI